MALLNQVSHSIKIKNPMSFNKYLSIFIIVLTPTFLFAQNKNLNYNKFKQLKEEVAEVVIKEYKVLEYIFIFPSLLFVENLKNAVSIP